MSTVAVDWDHVYLLYYERPDGTTALTTWDDGGTAVYIWVVVVGDHAKVPLWDSPVPEGMRLEPMPHFFAAKNGKDDRDTERRLRAEYAKQMGGVAACGWLQGQPIERKPPRSIWHELAASR